MKYVKKGIKVENIFLKIFVICKVILRFNVHGHLHPREDIKKRCSFNNMTYLYCPFISIHVKVNYPGLLCKRKIVLLYVQNSVPETSKTWCTYNNQYSGIICANRLILFMPC